MKKSFICSGLGMIFFMLDNETGKTTYTDQEGNQREINSNEVAQFIEAD
ncbi:DUF903 domain-containing protein [Salmonella enterica subsp. arizonae serovar 40:z4,z23:-]|nr:DUF903 domain-containing protein [Salmonella enterica subsp. arizonae serovar 40:z4,z23:-]EJS3274936.1 DUF903 domain-containing protein [Salmonella enterica]